MLCNVHNIANMILKKNFKQVLVIAQHKQNENLLSLIVVLVAVRYKFININ